MNREDRCTCPGCKYRGVRKENKRILAYFAHLAVKITECMFYGGDNLMGKKKMCQGHYCIFRHFIETKEAGKIERCAL